MYFTIILDGYGGKSEKLYYPRQGRDGLPAA